MKEPPAKREVFAFRLVAEAFDPLSLSLRLPLVIFLARPLRSVQSTVGSETERVVVIQVYVMTRGRGAREGLDRVEVGETTDQV